MKIGLETAALVGACLLAGCAGATINLGSTNSPAFASGAPPPGNAYSSGSVALQADVAPGVFIGALLFGYLAAGAHDDYLDWRYGRAGRAPPPLAADRAVAERDCSRPMHAPSANLRCK